MFDSISNLPNEGASNNLNICTYNGCQYDPTNRASLKTFLKHPSIKENILNRDGTYYFLDHKNNNIIVIPHANFSAVRCIEVKGVGAINLVKCAHIYFTALPKVNTNIAKVQAGKYDDDVPNFTGFEVDTETGSVSGFSDNLKGKIAFDVDKNFKKNLDKIINPPSEEILNDKKAFDPKETDRTEEEPKFQTWSANDPGVYTKAPKWKFWSNGTFNEKNISQNGYWFLSSKWKKACDAVYELVKEKKYKLNTDIAKKYNSIEKLFKTDQMFPQNMELPPSRKHELFMQQKLNNEILAYWRDELRNALKIEKNGTNFETPEQIKTIPSRFLPLRNIIIKHLVLEKFFKDTLPSASTNYLESFGKSFNLDDCSDSPFLANDESTNPNIPISPTSESNNSQVMLNGLPHEFPPDYPIHNPNLSNS